ncbi:MAG: NifB/NifX family molybdenum-iron cluster-binding protein [Desulfobulbaceae bacterium]
MKILITIQGDDVAPRFDLTREALIAHAEGGELLDEPRIILLPGSSGEELCGHIIKENMSHVVCGGIEDVHFQYLAWKKITVIDGVIGPYHQALEELLHDRLIPWSVLAGAARE